MSMWTHITACLSVDTLVDEETDAKDSALMYLADAPKMTGSEGDASIYVNLKDDYNSWTNCDCPKCEYKDTIVLHIREKDRKCIGHECDSPEGFQCPEGEHQSRVIISVQGDLRDKGVEKTREEFEAFKSYVDEKYMIRDYAVNIE